MTKTVWLVLFGLLAAIGLISAFKLISIQARAAAREAQPSIEQSIKKQNDYNERGAIFDRSGNILAMQVKSWNVGLRLIDTQNPEETISLLSGILSLAPEQLKQDLADPSKYVQVKRLISKEEHDQIARLQTEGKLVGVQMQNIAWRKYPGIDSISQVIGYFGSGGKGLDGVEYSYDSYLQPKENGLGDSVYLTIDSVLQKSIEQIVKETREESGAAYIDTILMDAKSGEILSYVSIPGFDNNRYYTYQQSELANRIIQYNYEPGSVFKVFTIASLLDANFIEPSSMFDASGPFRDERYGFVISDLWYPGIITTSDIIKYSSNVGTSRAVSRIDDVSYYRYLREFGFGSKTGVALPGESGGILYDPKQWSARSRQTIGIGQEIAVTAMQIIAASTALANGGVLLKPHIVKKITSSSGDTVFKSEREPVRQVIRTDTARSVLNMMETTTEPGGTAFRMRTEGISISAKTGTAQVFDVKNKQYSSEKFIASTLAIVPTEDPQIIIYAAIHNPTSGEIYGGRTTAPMIRRMLNFILPYLGMAGTTVAFRYSPSAPEFSRIRPVAPPAQVYDDYTGLSKREAVTLFVGPGIKLSVRGSGFVVRQEPAPGEPVHEGQTLTLYLQ